MKTKFFLCLLFVGVFMNLNGQIYKTAIEMTKAFHSAVKENDSIALSNFYLHYSHVSNNKMVSQVSVSDFANYLRESENDEDKPGTYTKPETDALLTRLNATAQNTLNPIYVEYKLSEVNQLINFLTEAADHNVDNGRIRIYFGVYQPKIPGETYPSNYDTLVGKNTAYLVGAVKSNPAVEVYTDMAVHQQNVGIPCPPDCGTGMVNLNITERSTKVATSGALQAWDLVKNAGKTNNANSYKIMNCLSRDGVKKTLDCVHVPD